MQVSASSMCIGKSQNYTLHRKVCSNKNVEIQLQILNERKLLNATSTRETAAEE